jgi:hypothetical protein
LPGTAKPRNTLSSGCDPTFSAVAVKFTNPNRSLVTEVLVIATTPDGLRVMCSKGNASALEIFVPLT